MTGACPACGGADLYGFHDVEDVPTNSCLLLADADEALSFPRGRLNLAACRRCGFITNRAFDPTKAEYSGRYEETQSYSPTFVEFGQNLAKQWVERFDLHGRHVLEIGCGKGEFLSWMIEAGAGTATGIDPGVHPERLDAEVASRIEWIADFYSEAYLHLEADAIVCRHTLEHIAPVRTFLDVLSRHAGGREIPVLFELPDTRRVLDEVAFWDLYYEHCSYFTAGSLVSLFERCGFEVSDVRSAYDDQYLLLEATSGSVSSDHRTDPDERVEAERVLAAADRFASAYEQTVESWRSRLDDVQRTGGRTLLWGGGSKAVAFLTTPALQDVIDGVVDINPHKQGRFIAGTGHRVLSPDEVAALDPDLVVVANPIYVGEVATELTRLGIDSEVVGL